MTGRRWVAAGGALTVSFTLAALAAIGDGDPAAPAAAAAPEVGETATVERRDLVERDTLDGTLRYADASTLAAGVAGTVTRLRRPGAVVARGEWLYAVDGRPAAWLMYGDLPAWRDFTPWMEDGADVRQLEANLRALGHEDVEADGSWDAATTAAVRALQEARGMEEDGTLGKDELVFRPGETRIGQVSAVAGQPSRPGLELATISSTRREVVVDLDARRQSLAREGDAVTVGLPTGRTARGRVTDVGKVAELPPGGEEDGAEPTIEVTIALRGRAARGTGLDQAPVDVGFAVERREGVLAVPVKALLARQGGSFAVELVEGGSTRVVEVEPGLYADDLVEVAGDLEAGQTVVTAR